MTEHAGSQLPLAMLLVFGTAKILGEISERLALPSIVGDILAGVLLGASVLNWVEPGQITQFSDLGVMFLLFRVGLEVKASDLFQVGRVASLVALLGVLLPFAMGYAIYIYTGSNQIEALFVGAAMVATSVGITAQVLAAKGLLNVRASRIILAAAVIDDILGLIVLAIVSSMARGTFDVLQLTTTAGLSIGFTLFVLSFGSRTMGRVLPGIDRRLRGGESQFSLAMILLFALAVFASYAGVAAIIGAFLAGVALAESVSHRVQDLAQGVTELLVPFFLAGIGLALDVNVLRDPRTLTLAGVITVAAIVSKLLGCGLGALSLGWPDARRIGAGMVPRGEVGMVVAQLGAAMGIVSKATYGVVVVMAVLTTVVAPVLLALTFRSLAQMPEDPDESPIRIE
ncbi:MAG: cation:proton antiporter [Acidobacteria bacterium]|jgi:Kef-type K+ transport system membrane component KefB|nr:cation:proton antiporter [Bryobacteraceae bacterium CoA2 C42]